MIEIRLARNADAPELARLNGLYNGDGNNSIATIEESLNGNDQEIVCVAAVGNKLVGFCCGQILESMCYSYKYAEITELYVMDEYRRQGIGRQLLSVTETELSECGVKHLHILTGGQNCIAQTLYRSCGYDDTSEILLEKSIF